MYIYLYMYIYIYIYIYIVRSLPFFLSNKTNTRAHRMLASSYLIGILPHTSKFTHKTHRDTRAHTHTHAHTHTAYTTQHPKWPPLPHLAPARSCTQALCRHTNDTRSNMTLSTYPIRNARHLWVCLQQLFHILRLCVSHPLPMQWQRVILRKSSH